jgi:ankyrin repeat protein
MKRLAQVLLAALLSGSTTTSYCAVALVEAVSRNDETAVTTMLQSGGDPNERRFGTTGLHLAAEWGFTRIVELLLKGGAKSDAVDNYQRTPLIWATLNGHSDVAHLLIAAGGDLSWRDEEGNSALSNAAADNDKELVKLLIDSGGRIGRDDGVALRKAIDAGDAQIVRQFIEIGADPCFHPGNDITKFTAAGGGKSLEVVKILAAVAANCSEPRTLLSDMITAAAGNGRLDFVEYLLPLLATARDAESERAKYLSDSTARALAAAVKADRFEVAKFLLEKATDLSPQKRGELLAGALEGKHPAMFHLLLEHGAALNERDDAGMSPLLQCAWDGDLENAKLLIGRGATVKASATHSTTPLIIASRLGSVPLVELFLRHGATCRELDEGKRGPLLAAAMGGKADVCRILLQHGCDPNIADPDTGFTALHYAASQGDTDTAEALLSARANPALKDKSNRTARDVAEEGGATEVVALLSHAPDRKERRSHH